MVEKFLREAAMIGFKITFRQLIKHPGFTALAVLKLSNDE